MCKLHCLCIGVRSGGAALIEALESIPAHDWRGGVHTGNEMEILLALWGIPVCKGNRAAWLDGPLKPAFLEKPSSGGTFYSAARVMRLLYKDKTPAQHGKRHNTLTNTDNLSITNIGHRFGHQSG